MNNNADFVGQIDKVVKYINDNSQNIDMAIKSVVASLKTISGVKISDKEIILFKNNAIMIISAISDVLREMDSRGNYLTVAKPIINKFNQASNIIMSQLVRVVNNMNKFGQSLANADFTSIARSSDMIFDAYIHIFMGAARLAYFLKTGKSHWWQFFDFMGKTNVNDMRIGIVETTILTPMISKMFEMLKPITSQLDFIGSNQENIKKGLNGLQTILFGETKHHLFKRKDSTPGLFTLFAMVGKQQLDTSLKNIISMIKILGMVSGFVIILFGISKILSLMGQDIQNIKLGLKAISIIVGGKKSMIAADIPGVFSTIDNIGINSGGDDLKIILNKGLVLLATIPVLLVFKIILKILASISEDNGIKNVLRTINMVVGGKKAKLKGLIGGVPGIFESIEGIDFPGGAIAMMQKCIILIAVAAVVTMLRYIISQLSAIGKGFFKKRRIKTALKIIKNQIPELINILENINIKTSVLIQIIGKLLLLASAVLIISIIIGLISICGVLAIFAISGILSMIVIVWGLRVIINILNKFNFKHISKAVLKVAMLVPLVLGLVTMIASIAAIGIKKDIILQAGLFIIASLILVMGLFVIVYITQKLNQSKIMKGISMIKLLLNSLVNIAVGFSLIKVLGSIKKLNFTPKDLLQVLLFCAASSILVMGLTIIIYIMQKINQSKIMKGISMIKLLLSSLFNAAVGITLIYVLTEIKKLNYTFTNFLSLLLFCAASTILILMLIFLVRIVAKFGGPSIKGTAIIAGILVVAIGFARTFMTINAIISSGAINILNIILFTLGVSIIVILLTLTAVLIGMIPGLGKIILGLLVMGLIMIAAIGFAYAFMVINKVISKKVININGLVQFALGIVILIGIFSLLGLATPLIVAGTLGILALTIGLWILILVVFTLREISEMDMSFLNSAKDNVKAVIAMCDEIISSFLDHTVIKPESVGSEYPWFNKLISHTMGPIASLVSAFLMAAYVAFIFITLGLIILIMYELTTIEKISFDPDKINKKIDLLLNTIEIIIAKLFNQKTSRNDGWFEGKNNTFITEGILGVIVRLIGGDTLLQVWGLIERAAILLCVVIIVGLLVVAATMISLLMKCITKFEDDLKSLPEKIDTLLDTITKIIDKLRNTDLHFDKAEKDDGIITKICRYVLPKGVMDIAAGIATFGKIAELIAILGLICLVAVTADKTVGILNKYAAAPKNIARKTQNLINAVMESVKALNGMEADDKFSKLSENVSGYEKIVKESDKLINKVNGLNLNKMKAFAEMWKQAAAFSHSINGNFDRLASAISEKLAPILKELKDAILEADKTIKERTNKMNSNNMSDMGIMNNTSPLTTMSNPAQQTIKKPTTTGKSQAQIAQSRRVAELNKKAKIEECITQAMGGYALNVKIVN